MRELRQAVADFAGIPVDRVPYSDVMGVPITFLDKYNPEQFKLLGCSYSYGRPAFWPKDTDMTPTISGRNVYKRLFIRLRAA